MSAPRRSWRRAPAATSSRAWRSRARCSAAAGRVSWLGTAHGMENQPGAGRPASRSTRIGFSGLRGKGLLHTLTGGLRLLKAFWDCLAHPAPARRRRGAGHGRLRLLPRRADGLAAGQAAGAGERRRVAAAEQQALLPVADRVAFGFDGAAATTHKQRRRHRQPGARRDRGAARARPSASPAAAARCSCWWSAAAWARRVLNETLPQALALLDAGAAAAASLHQTGALQRRRACAQAYAGGRRCRRRRGAALHRRHGRAPGRLRRDGLPRRRGDGQRAVRRRRAGDAGAADRQHHLAPARQRACSWRSTARRCTCRRPS